MLALPIRVVFCLRCVVIQYPFSLHSVDSSVVDMVAERYLIKGIDRCTGFSLHIMCEFE